MLFYKDTEVYLSSQGAIAGKGIVIKDQSTNILRGVPLGNSRVGVSITEVFDTNAFLPYPAKWLLSLGDAIDEIVIWDLADLRLQADQINIDTAPHFDGILQKSMLRPTSVEGHDGDPVALIISGCKAADTVIHHVDDARNCHGIPLGPDKVNMRITKFPASSGTLELPFPHSGAHTIAKALGTVILWEIKNLKWATNEQDVVPEVGSSANGFASDEGNVLNFPLVTLDFLIQSNWDKLQVELFSPDCSTHVGIGIVTVWHHTSFVNDILLGYSLVGMTVLKVKKMA
jgi:hypothetical protein